MKRKPPSKTQENLKQQLEHLQKSGLLVVFIYWFSVCVFGTKKSKPKRTKNVNNPRTRTQICNKDLVLEPPCRLLQCPKRTEKESLPPNKWRWMKENKVEHPVPCSPRPEAKTKRVRNYFGNQFFSMWNWRGFRWGWASHLFDSEQKLRIELWKAASPPHALGRSAYVVVFPLRSFTVNNNNDNNNNNNNNNNSNSSNNNNNNNDNTSSSSSSSSNNIERREPYK